MSARPDLVLLTAAYPFGNKSETFLESEIGVLAARFGRVFVLPSHRQEGVRPLPDDVRLVEMEWLAEPAARRRRRALVARRALGALAATLARGSRAAAYLAGARTYLDILARNVLKAAELETWIGRAGAAEAVFYDYWFENTTLALAMLRSAGVVRTAVSRAHGFDVYDERWGGRPVPFREVKAAGLDRIFAVSDFGTRYLRAKLPAATKKIETAHLGVAPGRPVEAERGEVPLVLTCGSLLPDKRFHLVPEVLAALRRQVRWVHLGDGSERARVEAAAAALPDAVSWSLPGHLDNRDVLRFYERNRVDVLLSLSVSEGLPVSMMEAIAHGVPVVAVGVHGVPEIVTERTGILLDGGATPGEAARALAEALEPGRFAEQEIRAFHRERFDAEANFNRFADALIALREAQAAAG